MKEYRNTLFLVGLYSDGRSQKVDDFMAQWANAGWELVAVTEQRSGQTAVSSVEYSMFWSKDKS